MADLEGNNLLPKLTNLWCAAAVDVRTRERFEWEPDGLDDAVKFFEDCYCLIGHNFLDYDIRALEMLYPSFKRPMVRDTLIMAKVVWPPDTLWAKDMKLANMGKLPRQYIKRHSLAAWGCRLGNNKGDYTTWCKERGLDPWSEWRPEMQTYMVQDVDVNVDLWDLICEKIGWTNTGDELQQAA